MERYGEFYIICIEVLDAKLEWQVYCQRSLKLFKIYTKALHAHILHVLFNSPFIQNVKKSIVGAKACGEVLSCPSFADDVTVITFSKKRSTNTV